MDRVANLADTGGLAVVVLADGMDMPTDFALHPQCVAIPANELPADREELNNAFPSTTKIVLLGGEVRQPTFVALKAVLERRQVPFVHRRNAQALADNLRALLPTTKAAGTSEAPRAPRGETLALAREADLSKGSAEEARRLFVIAQRRGLSTTVASLAQSISKLKRGAGRTDTPPSLMNAQQRALVTLDEGIAEIQDLMARLQLVREYVAETETLNVSLRRKLAKMNELLTAD